MTKKELLDYLVEECLSGDEEADHVNADMALLKYINDPAITEAFHKIDKWYS